MLLLTKGVYCCCRIVCAARARWL